MVDRKEDNAEEGEMHRASENRKRNPDRNSSIRQPSDSLPSFDLDLRVPLALAAISAGIWLDHNNGQSQSANCDHQHLLFLVSFVPAHAVGVVSIRTGTHNRECDRIFGVSLLQFPAQNISPLHNRHLVISALLSK